VLIEKELEISVPHSDAADVHPRGVRSSCDQMMSAHAFFSKIEAAGFVYELCGRCGTVRITEKRS
jgi:hypothetical protein